MPSGSYVCSITQVRQHAAQADVRGSEECARRCSTPAPSHSLPVCACFADKVVGMDKKEAEVKFRIIKSAYDEILKGRAWRRTPCPHSRARHTASRAQARLRCLLRACAQVKRATRPRPQAHVPHPAMPKHITGTHILHTSIPHPCAKTVCRGYASSLARQNITLVCVCMCVSCVHRARHGGMEAEGPVRCGGPYGGFASEGDFYRYIRDTQCVHAALWRFSVQNGHQALRSNAVERRV